MANISNISELRQVNKKLHKKMAFNKGEIIRARVKAINGNKMIQLNTIDGWEFNGEVEKNLDEEFLGKFLKFKVKGIKDGKLQIEIVHDENSADEENKSFEKLMGKLGLKKNAKNTELLKMMIKFKIPLNKEKVSELKSLIQFKENIQNDSVEKQKFMDRLIDFQGKENTGESLSREKIGAFLRGIEKLDSKSLMFMFKNNIVPSGDNIEAFNKINNGKTSIFALIKDMGLSVDADKIEVDNTKVNIESNIESEISPKGITNKNSVWSALNNYSSNEGEKLEFVEKMLTDILKESTKEELKELRDLGNKIGLNREDEKVSEKMSEKVSEKVSEKDMEKGGKVLQKNEKQQQSIVGEKIIGTEGSKKIKESIIDVLKDTKETIKMLMSEEKEGLAESAGKIAELVQKNMNNIKVFNSINNEYYYFDSPINYKEQEYPMKFIIKDERKKEKKIDSKNVKMVVSLTTKNIGVVDAYITIKNRKISIDLKCIAKWKRMIEVSKGNLQDRFDLDKYDIKISVQEKVDEVTIVNCNDFFEDREFKVLDARV